MSFRSEVIARYKITAKETIVAYRAINGIEPKDVNHRQVGSSLDAVFGLGTYFAFSEKDAKKYVDTTKGFSLIIKYTVKANKVLSLYSGSSAIDGLNKPSHGITVYDIHLSNELGDDFDGDELVERAFKCGYDAIALYDDDETVDGGEQLIVPPKAKVEIMPMSYTRITKEKTQKNIEWPM